MKTTLAFSRKSLLGLAVACAAGALVGSGCSTPGAGMAAKQAGPRSAPPSLTADDLGGTPSPAPTAKTEVASNADAPAAPTPSGIPAPPMALGTTKSTNSSSGATGSASASLGSAVPAENPLAEPVAPGGTPSSQQDFTPANSIPPAPPAAQPVRSRLMGAAPSAEVDHPIQQVQHLETGEAPVAVLGEPPALPPSHSADHGPPIMTPWGEVCPHCQPVTAQIWSRKAAAAAAARAAAPGAFGDPAAAPQPPSMAPYSAGPQPYAGWRPDGLPAPWPLDEWIFDGGDMNLETVVDPDWRIRGLDIEDAVGHFDTLDGRTEVRPSNRVAIYAPRFAAVRQTKGVIAANARDYLADTFDAQKIEGQSEHAPVTTALQPMQPQSELGTRVPIAFLDRQSPRRLDGRRPLATYVAELRPHEDFLLTRTGELLGAEKPRLAGSVDAALVWTEEQSVQVVVDQTVALEQKGLVKPQEAYLFERAGRPQMRVVKMASRGVAQPGEEIEFTLRYDNVGEQVIGNVTILDNLTTRLEYIEGTAQSSREAEFFVEENEARSLVLRWEVRQPLPVGEGGVVRFKARVR